MAWPSKRKAFIALSAAATYSDAYVFTRNNMAQQRQASVQLSASKTDENTAADGWRKLGGGVAAFLAGASFMAQVALADSISTAPVDQASTQVQSSTVSSNVLVSVGAPAFGGGGSFDTLDFSLPSYDKATKGGDITKSAESDDGDATAKVVAESEIRKQTEEDVRESKNQAGAEAKASSQKEASEKAAKKEAAERAKEDRKAAEKEKQRLAVERQKAAKEEVKEEEASALVEALKDTKVSGIQVPEAKVPDVKLPEIKAPSFSFSLPKAETSDIKIPGASIFDIPAPPKVDVPAVPKVDILTPQIKSPKFDIPDMPKIEAPKMPSFSLPKLDIPDAPKFDMPKADVPALPKVDLPAPPVFSTPAFDRPTSSSPLESEAEFLEPQEIRDARAAEKNILFKETKAEANEAEKAARIAKEKAKEAKKVFKEAKGEACKTRFGGKFICLRGFGVGY